MATPQDVLAFTEGETDLDLVAITDHDQIGGALEAVEWCAGRPGGRLHAVVGTEISASWGRHVVALFFDEPYPTVPFARMRPLRETAQRVADRGGVLVLPHALSSLVPSVGERALRHLLADQRARETIMGIEVCSGVVGGRVSEPKLRALNEARWHLAPLGCSDAHHLEQIGLAYTAFPGHTAADLFQALQRRETNHRLGCAGECALAASRAPGLAQYGDQAGA